MRITHYLIAVLMFLYSQNSAISESDRAIEFEISYTGEIWQIASGGLRKDTVYLHNFDLSVGGALDKYGLEGGSFLLYGLTNNFRELSADSVGDIQVVSNIDNGEIFRLFEAWYQHEFDTLRLKAGLIDLNSEFDAIEPAGLFINSSHGIGPDFSQTGENGPSIFPNTSPALLLDYSGFENMQIMAGIFDAVPNDPDNPKSHKLSLNDGALLVGEVNYRAESGLRIGFGLYHYTSQFSPLLDPAASKSGNTGAYGIIEGSIADNISGWLRFGKANAAINPLKHYLGGGVVVSELAQGRGQFGLGFGWAASGDAFQQRLRLDGENPASGELNFELTYQYQITEYMALQPDIQYIINPGTQHDIKDALVIGLRFQIGHIF